MERVYAVSTTELSPLSSTSSEPVEQLSSEDVEQLYGEPVSTTESSPLFWTSSEPVEQLYGEPMALKTIRGRHLSFQVHERLKSISLWTDKRQYPPMRLGLRS